MSTEAEIIARYFHATYEMLAPEHGYKTREASAVPWDDVPENNRSLMVAVVQSLLDSGIIASDDTVEKLRAGWKSVVDDYDRLRRFIGTVRAAEIGEPEEIVAQYVAHYRAACQSNTFNGQITNLVKGMAVVAVRAIGSGRWANAEHANAQRLQAALRALVDRVDSWGESYEPTHPAVEEARQALAEIKLEEGPPPYALDISNLPKPDPEPLPPEGMPTIWPMTAPLTDEPEFEHQGEPFAARYPGICPNCPTTIVPGDMIVWVATRTWAHVQCPAIERRVQERIGSPSVTEYHGDDWSSDG